MYVPKETLWIILRTVLYHPIEHPDDLGCYRHERLHLLQRVILPGRKVQVDLLELRIVLDTAHCRLVEDTAQPVSSSLTDTRQSLPLPRAILHYSQSSQLLDLFRIIKPVNGSHLCKEPDHREVANPRYLKQLICISY